MLVLKYFPSLYETLVNAFLVVNPIRDQGYLSQSKIAFAYNHHT